ncbi:hypothetical protein PtB15_3B349 [Puccinia triticina]|nr:hypothetical protein PtB15_3B349 [Puccinia triticina]
MQFSVAVAVCLAFVHTSTARPFSPTLLGRSPVAPPDWTRDTPQHANPDYIHSINTPPWLPNACAQPGQSPYADWTSANCNQQPMPRPNPSPYPINNYPPVNPYSPYGVPSSYYSYDNSGQARNSQDSFRSDPSGTWGNSADQGSYYHNNGFGLTNGLGLNNGFGLFKKEAEPKTEDKSKA